MKKIRPKILTWLLLLVGISTMGYSQSHFTTVWEGNGYNHMNIYIQKATINGINLQAGDEIGVFDGDICVGVTVIYSVADVIQVRASEDDPTTPSIQDGFSFESAISFKIWSARLQQEIIPEVIHLSGANYFQSLGTGVFRLEANLAIKPVAEAGPDQIVAEGKGVKLDGSGSFDPGKLTITYSWVSPSGILMGAATTAYPIFTAPEVIKDTVLVFYLTVNNGISTSLPDLVKILVKNVNKAPSITGQQPIKVDEDAPFSIFLGNITYTDDDPKSPMTLQILPSESYRFTGNMIIPYPNFNGSLKIIVRIFDGELFSAPFALSVVVSPVNDAPQFSTFPLKKAIVDNDYIYSPSGSDVDGDAVTITPTTIPSWLTFSTASGKPELKGKPAKSDVVADGSLVELAISDGSLSGEVQSFKILIDTLSNAPYFVKGLLSPATVNAAYTETIGMFDVDSDTARITLYNAPAWLTINGTFGRVFKVNFANKLSSFVLGGTPTISDRGLSQLLFVADDGIFKKTRMMPLAVVSVNTPPVATDKTINIKEDEPLLVVLEGTDLETPSNLNYVITTQPIEGSITRLGRNVIIYRPLSNFFGTDSFGFTVSEPGIGGLSDAGTISITVASVNDRPTIVGENNIFRLLSGESVALTGITMADVADAGSASALELASLYGPFHGSFATTTQTYTAASDFVGVDMVYLSAKEVGVGGLYSKPLPIRFVVTRPNTAPESFPKTVLTKEDKPVSFSLGISDLEEDISRLSIQVDSLPKHGVLSMVGGLVTYSPNADWSGVDSLVYKVIDSQGAASDTSLVTIICLPVNDVPIITSNLSISMGGSTTKLIDFTPFFTDIDSPVDSLRVEFLINDNLAEKGLSILKNPLTVDPVNKLLYTFTQASLSADVIPFRIYDGVGTSLPGALVVNSARKSSTRANPEIYAMGDFYDITYGDSLWVYFTAISGDPNITEPLEIVLTNTEQFNGELGPLELYNFTPYNPVVVYRAHYVAPPKVTKRAQGNYTEVIFDDVPFKSRKKSKRADESVPDTLKIGNLGTKVATTIAAIGEKSVNEDASTDIQIFFTDADTQPASIAWSYSAKAEMLPTATITKVAAGEIKLSVTPQPNFVGAIDFTVFANDGDTTVSKDFRLNVVNVNDAPVVSVPDSLDYVPGFPMSILLSVNDIDNSDEELTYSAVADVSGIVDSVWFSGAYMMVAHKSGVASDYNLVLSVGDGSAQVDKTINMNYRDGNNVPELAAISSISSFEDQPVTLSVTPMDADKNDMLTVTMLSSDESIVKASVIQISPISAKTGIARAVTITPEANANGNVEVTFVVSDGFSSSAQQLVLNFFPVNDAPSLSPIAQVEMKPNTSASIPVVINDIDSYEIVLSASGATVNFNASLDGNILMVSAINGYEGTVTVDLVATDDSSATSTISVTFVVSSTSGVGDLLGNQPMLIAYPVPAQEMITIEHKAQEGITAIRIFDVTGKMVGVEQGAGELKKEINISGLPTGIYIVRVRFTNNQEIPLQIIKQ